MKLKSILSLSNSDIYTFMRKHPRTDLPLMIHYWKLGLLEYHASEKNLYEYLLAYGNNQDMLGSLVKGLLGSEFLRNIYSEKDPLTIVLKSHLILDNFIDKIIEKSTLSYAGLSFYSKVELLNNNHLLKEDIYNDLHLINKLRNKYAHDYYFDISAFDMSKFSICVGLYDGLPINKRRTQGILNIKAFQFFILCHLIERISYDFSFLKKIKNQKMSNTQFFKEEIGDKLGKAISKIHRLTKNSDFDFSVELKISEKEKVT